ncbi:Monomeric sarcosine oxidase [Phycisphaerae bacterium RAS2]|nr:Monomeric sarcosine oxidase [Phycisphaerae bacterium RAS2]
MVAMAERPFDAMVLGVGAMGAAACYHLAQRGLRVVGLEQFDLCHDRGSSHGRSRVFRKAYFEDPRYVPLLHEAYAAWGRLEQETGQTLLNFVGCLNIGRADHPCLRGVRASVTQHGLAHEVLSAEEVRRRHPAFEPPPDHVAVYEADAGYLCPEDCVRAMADRARRAGAELRERTVVRSWRALKPAGAGGAAVRVETDDGAIVAGALVITAGAWLPSIAAELGLPLTVERQVQAWFTPKEPARFAPGTMPVFIHFLDGDVNTASASAANLSGAFYGIPDHGQGVKIARHHGGTATTADTVDRAAHPADEADIRRYIRAHMPTADGPLRDAKVCLYTNTPDDHFVIDRHPSHENVFLAGGFSGHGFKFAPVVGEALADLVTTGHSRLPGELFAMGRFAMR